MAILTTRWIAPALALAAAAGCATRPLPPLIPEAADCRANFLGIDERVARADARNGGAHAIPGFPYLRSDRFLASFRHEVTTEAAFDAWVERLRQLDLQARASELRNLGWDDPAEELRHLDECGREWAARDLADPARRKQLRENAAVPDDYSLLRRTLGLYPVTALFLDWGIRDFNQQVVADYATPYEQLKSEGRLVLWQPATSVVGAPHGRDRSRDALGIPHFSDADWQALSRIHTPTWLIETTGRHDLLGSPVLESGNPAIDTSRPVTYFLPAFTRFGDRVLAQLVYVVWFAGRPKSDFLDPYGGPLDGLVWRVTLDDDGAPLLYDVIHACGCYHYYYVPEAAPGSGAKALQRRRPGSSLYDEPLLFPQDAPRAPFAIRVQSGTHYVRRLVPLQDVSAAEVRTFASAPYDELLSLPDVDGRRSLFGPDGLAEGTERLERFFLWPAGIKSAGAMRQWGRHATSFVGRSHFDEPRMLERLFVP